MRRDCQGPFLNDETLGTSYRAGTEGRAALSQTECLHPPQIHMLKL